MAAIINGRSPVGLPAESNQTVCLTIARSQPRENARQGGDYEDANMDAS